MRNSHCSYCGSPFAADQPWPRVCSSCSNVSYRNPVPVAVGLIPVDGGLLLIRRAVAPQIGGLALPGGFVNYGESWQEACVRELEEETGLKIPAEEVTLYDALSAPEGMVLIFGLVNPRTAEELPVFAPNSETTEFTIMREPGELAFPLHTRVANRYWSERK